MTSFNVIIGLYGDIDYWENVALSRAVPSLASFDDDVWLTLTSGPDLHTAFNEAGLSSDADYLVFLGADDELHPEYFDGAREVIERLHPDVVMPTVQIVLDDIEHTPVQQTPVPWHIDNFIVAGAPTLTEKFREVGGYKDWAVAEDWDLFWRLAEAGASFAYSPRSIYRYFQHTRLAPGQPQHRNKAPTKLGADTWDAIRESHQSPDERK